MGAKYVRFIFIIDFYMVITLQCDLFSSSLFRDLLPNICQDLEETIKKPLTWLLLHHIA